MDVSPLAGLLSLFSKYPRLAPWALVLSRLWRSPEAFSKGSWSNVEVGAQSHNSNPSPFPPRSGFVRRTGQPSGLTSLVGTMFCTNPLYRVDTESRGQTTDRASASHTDNAPDGERVAVRCLVSSHRFIVTVFVATPPAPITWIVFGPETNPRLVLEPRRTMVKLVTLRTNDVRSVPLMTTCGDSPNPPP